MTENKERFITSVKTSALKKKCVPEKLIEIMNVNKFFTNEDLDLDGSSYNKWNSYEIKLIRRFLDANTYRYTVGELLDAELITESSYTRRKLVYSGFSKTQLLNQKKAKDREIRIDKILA